MKRRMAGWLAVAAIALSAGCLQIETRIKLNEDGSARVTERVAFSRRLLDLTGGPAGEYAKLLGKERCLERAKVMGEGVTLVKHESRTNEDGSMESTAEFSLPNLDGFRYVAPWLGHADYATNSVIRVRLAPRYKHLQWSEHTGGTMEVRFEYEKLPQMPRVPGKDAPPLPTPLDEQTYRDLAPVFRELLRDFRVRLTFEGYAPPVGKRIGRSVARSAEVDLLDVSDAHLDVSNAGFFEDEEKMLELARLNFAGPRVSEELRGAGNNLSLPMLQSFIFSAGAGFPASYDCIWLPPSRLLFDKHFAGKSVTLDEKKEVPARFEEIGWHGWQGKLNGTTPAAGGK